MLRRLLHGKPRTTGDRTRSLNQAASVVSDGEIDALLSMDPVLWTSEELRTVRTAYDRLTRDITLGTILGSVSAEGLTRIYRRILRALPVPVIIFGALYVWGHLLPPVPLRILRVLDELVLIILAIEVYLVSRHMRYYQVATSLASRADDSIGALDLPEPRRLMEDLVRQRGRVRVVRSQRRISMDPPM